MKRSLCHDSDIEKLCATSLLSYEQEKALLEQVRGRGSTEARNRLVLANTRLVVSIARSEANSAQEFQDFFSEGIGGLIQSIERFDLNKGTRLSTYATPWIRQAIDRAARFYRRDNGIKRSRGFMSRLRSLKRSNPDKSIGSREVMEEFGCNAKTAELLLEALRSDNTETISTDKPVAGRKSDGTMTIGDLVIPPSNPWPEVESFTWIAELLSCLNERQRLIFCLRVVDGLSFEEIAQAIGSNKHATSQCYYNAQLRLRNAAGQRFDNDR